MVETAYVDFGDDEGISANYGSVYVRDDATFVVAGSLLKVVDDDTRFGVEVEHRQTHSDQPPPPDAYKPFSDLLEITSTLLGSSVVKCEAQFEYDLGDAVRSRVKLPAPLLLGGSSEDYGPTHIESMVLSRREGHGVGHTVEVKSAGGDRIKHTVVFWAKTVVHEVALNSIFDMLAQFSQHLLEFKREAP